MNDSVSERRLRPIYDWLDNGNNKKALQEADKVDLPLFHHSFSLFSSHKLLYRPSCLLLFHIIIILSSVPDPWHFGTDPDPWILIFDNGSIPASVSESGSFRQCLSRHQIKMIFLQIFGFVHYGFRKKEDFSFWKTSFFLVEQVLRKQPELQCCRVLKSLALLRLGKEQEAEAILDKVNRKPGGLNQDLAKSMGLKSDSKHCIINILIWHQICFLGR